MLSLFRWCWRFIESWVFFQFKDGNFSFHFQQSKFFLSHLRNPFKLFIARKDKTTVKNRKKKYVERNTKRQNQACKSNPRQLLTKLWQVLNPCLPFKLFPKIAKVVMSDKFTLVLPARFNQTVFSLFMIIIYAGKDEIHENYKRIIRFYSWSLTVGRYEFFPFPVQINAFG